MGKKKAVKANYVQIAFQTDEQKFKMYMKLPKKDIAQMLMNCNNVLDQFTTGVWHQLTVQFEPPKKTKRKK